jgi:hypothetical protein
MTQTGGIDQYVEARPLAVSYHRIIPLEGDDRIVVEIAGGDLSMTVAVGDQLNRSVIDAKTARRLASAMRDRWGGKPTDAWPFADAIRDAADHLDKLAELYLAGADGTNAPRWINTRY